MLAIGSKMACTFSSKKKPKMEKTDFFGIYGALEPTDEPNIAPKNPKKFIYFSWNFSSNRVLINSFHAWD